MKTRVLGPAWLLLLPLGCASRHAPIVSETPSKTTPAPAPSVVTSSAEPSEPPSSAAPGAKRDPRASFAAWLTERLPAGGELIDEKGSPLGVVHVAKKGETWQSIAKEYVDLTLVYFIDDLAKEIVKANLPESKQGSRRGCGSPSLR